MSIAGFAQLLVSTLFLQPLEQSPPGAGVLINRTSRVVTVDVVDSEGRQSAWTLSPEGTLQLAKSRNYVIGVRGTATRFNVDVSRQFLRQYSDQGRIPLNKPEWEQANPEYYLLPPSRWATRYYQIIENDRHLQIVNGFSGRDVDRALAAYRRRLEELGLPLEPALLYQPYQSAFATSGLGINGEEDEGGQRTLGVAIRRLQHEAITDSLFEVASRPKQAQEPSTPAFVMGMLPTGVELFVGSEELQDSFQALRPAEDELRKMQALALVPPDVSPEMALFVKRLIAKILSLEEETVCVTAGPSAAPAPFPPTPLIRSYYENRALISQAIWKAFFNTVDGDSFLRTLTFEPAVTAREMRTSFFADPKPVVVLRTRSAWRYRWREDQISHMDSLPALRGMDLRWRIEVEMVIWEPEAEAPLFEMNIKTIRETKYRAQRSRDFATWTIGLPQFWIEPINGSTGKIDLEKRLLKLQETVATLCTSEE